MSDVEELGQGFEANPLSERFPEIKRGDIIPVCCCSNLACRGYNSVTEESIKEERLSRSVWARKLAELTFMGNGFWDSLELNQDQEQLQAICDRFAEIREELWRQAELDDPQGEKQ